MMSAHNVLEWTRAIIIFAGFLGVSIPKEGSDTVIGFVTIILGVMVLSSITNKIIISANEICKSRWLGLIKTRRSLDDFSNFSTLRGSTNGIYNGTDVLMHFKNRNPLLLRSFYRTQKIERFIAETKKAMSAV